MRELVELEEVDAHVRLLGQRGDDVGDEAAGGAHLLDLGGGAELDHRTTLAACVGVVLVNLVLGTMYFGTRTDEATSFALLDRYVEAGGRVLDTANCYSFWSSPSGHGGQSEAVIGRWLAANPGLREELVIATKVGSSPPTTEGRGTLRSGHRARAARSLERLGIDVIDLYWAHGEDRATDLGDRLRVRCAGDLRGRRPARRLQPPTWRVERGRAIAQGLGSSRGPRCS